MKVESTNQLGVGIIEVLVALTVFALGTMSVMSVVFGSQSLGIDSTLNRRSIELARKDNMQAVAAAHAGTTVNLTNVIDASETPFTITRSVLHASDCAADVVSEVVWPSQNNRSKPTLLASRLTNPLFFRLFGNDCPLEPAQGGWTACASYDTPDITPNGNEGRDVDIAVINGVRYIFLASKHTNAAEPDFWVYNAAQLNNVGIIGSIDTGVGLNSVDVAQSSNGNWYAYVGQDNNVGPNYNQLQVIDVSIPTAPTVVAQKTLPGVGNSFPEGWTVRFFGDKLYVGVRETTGRELHVYSVIDPTNPVHLGSRQINHNVEEIHIRTQVVSGNQKTLAYMATTDNNGEMWVMDVTNPAGISQLAVYNAPGNEDGNTISFSGNRLVLGRDRSASQHELLIVDISNPVVPILLGSKDIPLSPSTSGIIELIATGNFAFLATSDANNEFQAWNIADPTNFTRQCAPLNLPQALSGLDFLDNAIVTSIRSHDALRIIYDSDNPPN